MGSEIIWNVTYDNYDDFSTCQHEKMKTTQHYYKPYII
jgi:hypothetical protein